jgi:hypothetical protein
MLIWHHLRKYAKGYRFLVTVLFILCLAILVGYTLRWPLVNDAAYIHYVVFMLEHHHAPYRDLIDVQMPGAYAVDWLVMHTLGAGAVAWHLYDLGLLILAGIAMYILCKPHGRFAGFYAASLFAAFHARDGIAQSGQRDLTVSVLVFGGVAILMSQRWRDSLASRLGFGLCLGTAFTIKPTAILFLACFYFLPECSTRGTGQRLRQTLEIMSALLLPPIAVGLWLLENHALQAFWTTASMLVPLHARLGHPGLAYLLKWALSPSLLGLSCLAIACRFLGRVRLPERKLFLVGTLCGAASYFIQGKWFPYHRYPAYIFLFPLLTLELLLAIREAGRTRILGYTGLALGTIAVPLCVSRAIHDRWPMETETSLTADLQALALPGKIEALSGHVQCLDSISSCATTLYDLNLAQATGQMQDEILFAPPEKESPTQVMEIAKLRKDFLTRLTQDPPRVLIVSPWLFPEGPDSYQKLQRWPALSSLLRKRFRLRDERRFSPNINGPAGYRLYVLR